MQNTLSASNDAPIVHPALLVIPPSLRQRHIITHYLTRITQRLAPHPSKVAGHVPDLPLVITGGSVNARLAIDIVGDTQSLPREAYDAVGLVTKIMSFALTQAHNIQSMLPSPVCLVSDEWLNRTDLLQLNIEMFLAGVMAGDLSRGRALICQEKKPLPPLEKQRGLFLHLTPQMSIHPGFFLSSLLTQIQKTKPLRQMDAHLE